jgi:hypothetical protein
MNQALTTRLRKSRGTRIDSRTSALLRYQRAVEVSSCETATAIALGHFALFRGALEDVGEKRRAVRPVQAEVFLEQTMMVEYRARQRASYVISRRAIPGHVAGNTAHGSTHSCRRAP